MHGEKEKAYNSGRMERKNANSGRNREKAVETGARNKNKAYAERRRKTEANAERMEPARANAFRARSKMIEWQLIAEFEKNSREKIVASVAEISGRKIINIRLFWRESEAFPWKPSRKGFAFKAEFLSEFKRLISSVEKALNEVKLSSTKEAKTSALK